MSCEVQGCPAVSTPHGHMPEADRNWRPENKLTMSETAVAVAAVILAAYDGLTDEWRKAAEASQSGLSSADFETEIQSVRETV